MLLDAIFPLNLFSFIYILSFFYLHSALDGGPDLNETSGNNNNNMILDIPHSSAPDGSLYAQVKKSPSPEQSPVIPRMTNGDTNTPLPYVLSPDKAPQVNTSRDGGKRNMDYRERMALDELLKGITGEDTDGGIVVNNNTQWKAPPSPDINTVSVVTS